MLDLRIFLDFYFTKWLFMASVFAGLCKVVTSLVRRG